MLKRSILKISTFLMLMVSVALIFVACGKVEFKVNFVVDDEIYATINTNGEEVIKMPTDPTKEGYIFDGWYWDNNDWQNPFTANSLLDAPLSSDMSVYAKWATPDSLQGTEISIKDFESLSGDKYSLKVSNATASLSLGSYVSVNSKTKWTLSTDIYGNNTIASKVATLSIGDNTYYVLVTADNGSTQLYTLQIRRKPIYNVIFDTAGGTAVQKQEVEEDSLATAPETTKEGYTFASWNYDFSNPITDNMVVVASWNANSYKINYDVNGGELENKHTEVTFDQNYQLSTPTKRGYSFIGWYNGEDLVENGIYKTAGDTNLKASWEIIDYKITYDLKGGSVAIANPSTYTVETDNIILNNPTQLGYEFIGWTGTDVTEPSKGVIIYSNSIGDRTYTANWEFNGYKINYHLNGGENNSNNPATYTVEDEITLQAPTKVTDVTTTTTTYLGNGNYSVEQLVTAYTFLGWFADENFENSITTISGTSAVVLYAKWSENTTTTTTTTTIQAYSRDGKYVYFGSYPQTKVTNSTLTTSLNSLAGALPTSGNNQKWTSYGYYISGSVSNYMWYIDVEYSEAKYRGVYFTSYRPYYCTNRSSSSNGYQDDNGYYTSTVYWFKYEPIKWQILEESNGYATILADLALDSQQYDYDGSYSNNYANSTIRAWLNDTFYNTAFNDFQKALIQTVTVDNSASSTGSSSNSYACANTNDKVWLLSYTEAFNKYFSSNSERTKKSSDYAKSQGCWTSKISGYEGNCYWWLRSPYFSNSYRAWSVSDDGIYDIYSVYLTNSGVVPALKIKLS